MCATCGMGCKATYNSLHLMDRASFRAALGLPPHRAVAAAGGQSVDLAALEERHERKELSFVHGAAAAFVREDESRV